MKKFACLFLVLAMSGCPDIDNDGEETATDPVVEFDPSNKIVPFPNNLLIDPMTGKVNLPAQCGESPTAKGLREGVLNKLDGFGTYQTALTVTLTEAVDPTSLTDKVVLVKRATGMTPVDPSALRVVPTIVQASVTARFDANCMNPQMIPQLVIIPAEPLEQKSTYVVALLDGIKTASGKAYKASGTWALVRSSQNPVTIENGVVTSNRTPLDPADTDDFVRLVGIDTLWKAHAAAVKFLGDADAGKYSREKLLIAWEFKTQTTTDALDPAVTTSPTAKVTAMPLAGNVSQPALIDRTMGLYAQCPVTDNNTQCFLKIALGGGNYALGNGACATIDCAAVGDVLGSALLAKQYQVSTPNPFDATKPIPGPWGDALAPTEVRVEQITTLTLVPAAAPPATGYPVVVFQHGLTRSSTDVFAIAGNLTRAGFAVVAIDAVAHGSRAVRISDNAATLCAGTPTAPGAPQCFAPFLSPNLAATRDNIRQTVVDHHQLVASLKACGITACGATLKVDPAHIVYMGQSLGGIIGSTTTATNPDIKAAVLNVAGAGWVDILENTASLGIQCSLVDGLIAAGILVGEPSNLAAMPPTGLCTTPAWKTQPGYRTFSSIGRWVLDPADPANFNRKLAAKKFLLQEVVDDQVVPNIATDREGALVGQMPGVADSALPPPAVTSASAVITTNPTNSKWVRYPMVPADAASGFPGNSFSHGSLLQPAAASGPAGSLGTLRMRTDAITFLFINK